MDMSNYYYRRVTLSCFEPPKRSHQKAEKPSRRLRTEFYRNCNPLYWLSKPRDVLDEEKGQRTSSFAGIDVGI